MSITKIAPATILLGGAANPIIIGDLPAGGTITPGYLIERYDSGSGVAKLRAHSTAAGAAAKLVALNASMLNKGIDDTYISGDLVEAVAAGQGTSLYMLIASGEVIVVGDFLESKGNGTLRKYGSGVRLFQALENVDNGIGITAARVRVEAL